MKILIITYTREVNPGTFLQAYGVQYGLKQIFPKASIEYINHERLYFSVTVISCELVNEDTLLIIIYITINCFLTLIQRNKALYKAL